MVINKIYALEEVHTIAEWILNSCQNSKIFTFEGELGAGKTTLIKSICSQLGYNEEVTSPTFSIVNEYLSGKNYIYHMDLYRIKDLAELEDIGFDDYLCSGHYCLIEWPQIAEELLYDKKYKILISNVDENSRRITITTC